MNEFFDSIKKTAADTAKAAAKVSSEMFDYTKTSINMKFEEVKKASFQKVIGKMVYDEYKHNPDTVSDSIKELCKCIDEIEKNLNQQKQKIAQIKNKKYCIECGTQIGISVKFCFACGAHQPEPEPDECDCCCGEAHDGETAECDCCCEDENCDCADDLTHDDSCGCCCETEAKTDAENCTCADDSTHDDSCECGCDCDSPAGDPQ